MSVKIKKHTSWEIEHDGNSFPVDFEPLDYGIDPLIHISGDGKRAVVGFCSPDEDTHGYYWTENDCGQYLNFDRHTIHDREMVSPEELAELIQANPGRVFWVNKYDHSLVKFYREGDALTMPVEPGTEPAQEGLHIPDQQWDVSRGCALYIAPDDCPKPAEYCDAVLEEWTDWCNGSIYGVVVVEYKLVEAVDEDDEAEWEETEPDECWGFIGCEHAETSLKDEFERTVESV